MEPIKDPLDLPKSAVENVPGHGYIHHFLGMGLLLVVASGLLVLSTGLTELPLHTRSEQRGGEN